MILSHGLTASQVVELLDLQPHPEGGHYRETYRSPEEKGGRGTCTLIYYLLARGERSHWHRVDALEIWHWHGGAPLVLSISEDGQQKILHRLGNDLAAGERPQTVVPAYAWQAAESLGDWTLLGCTVTPAFRFEGFEIAPTGWHPSLK
jgi:hypothetical protein